MKVAGSVCAAPSAARHRSELAAKARSAETVRPAVALGEGGGDGASVATFNERSLSSAYGLMFWLTRKRFDGSYLRFTWASRAWLSRYEAFTLSSPSSIIMLM